MIPKLLIESGTWLRIKFIYMLSNRKYRYTILTYVLRREAAGLIRPSPGVTAGFGKTEGDWLHQAPQQGFFSPIRLVRVPNHLFLML